MDAVNNALAAEAPEVEVADRDLPGEAEACCTGNCPLVSELSGQSSSVLPEELLSVLSLPTDLTKSQIGGLPS